LLGKYLTWRTKYMCLYLNKQTCPSIHPFFLLFIFFIYSLSILSIPNIFLVFSIKCRPSKSEFELNIWHHYFLTLCIRLAMVRKL
jgi:hypothetical protein